MWYCVRKGAHIPGEPNEYDYVLLQLLLLAGKNMCTVINMEMLRL